MINTLTQYYIPLFWNYKYKISLSINNRQRDFNCSYTVADATIICNDMLWI